MWRQVIHTRQGAHAEYALEREAHGRNKGADCDRFGFQVTEKKKKKKKKRKSRSVLSLGKTIKS